MKTRKRIVGWHIGMCSLFFVFCLSFLNSVHGQSPIERGTATNNRGGLGGNILSGPGQGQQPYGYRNNDSTYSDTSATKGLEFHEEIPDSVLRNKVFFFRYNTKDVKINNLWNPTLDPTGAQFSDPLDGFNGDFYLGKGILGHPHLRTFYSFADGLSYKLQEDEMAGYIKTPETIRLYQTLTPYTLLSYNNTLKKDYLVHVAHTQNVKPGWNLSLDYLLMCPEGVLANSGAKNHHLDFTTNYFSPDSRLQVQAGIILQSFTIDENGGLTNDSYFTEELMSNYAGMPVRFNNSGAEHLRHDIFGRVTYNLVQQVERYRERDSLVVRLDTVSADNVVQSIDTLVVTDTLRVSDPRVLNAGVFGTELRYHRQKRAAYLPSYADSTLWSDASATLFWTNDAYPDYRWHNPLKITIGIIPHRFSATLRRDTLSAPDTLVALTAFNPFFRTELKLWSSSLILSGELDNTLLNLNPAIKKPDYHADMLLSIPFDSTKNTGLELTAAIQREMPEVRMLYSSGYTLQPIQSQRFGIHFYHSSDSSIVRLIDLNLYATQLDHYLWYDSSLAVVSGNNNLWLSQAALTMRIAWDWFHFDMQQLFQYSTDQDQVNVPLWTSKNSLYADFSLFGRALRMQLGTDIRYFSSFYPDSYDPATGLFYQQESKIGDYLWADIFLNLQVKRASIYLKAGHINALWENHPRYFLLPHYPGQKFGLFWGMTWHFFD